MHPQLILFHGITSNFNTIMKIIKQHKKRTQKQKYCIVIWETKFFYNFICGRNLRTAQEIVIHLVLHYNIPVYSLFYIIFISKKIPNIKIKQKVLCFVSFSILNWLKA